MARDISVLSRIKYYKYILASIKKETNNLKKNLYFQRISHFIASQPSSAMSLMTERDYIIVGPRNKHFYNENVLKQFQAWLMKNYMQK